jgi:hypothetical protein
VPVSAGVPGPAVNVVYPHGFASSRDEDSLRCDAFNSTFTQPTISFQGLRDASVEYRTVEAFAKTRRNVTLSLLNEAHQLIASLPRIWSDIRGFVGLDS